MPTPEKKFNKLKELLKMLDDSLTREEFITSFKNVVNLVLKVEKSLAEKNTENIAKLESLFEELKNGFENITNAELSRVINELKDIASKSLKEQQAGMNLIRDKVARIKEGKDGRSGRDGINGKDGKDGSPETPEQIRDKLEQLEENERLDKSAIKGLEELIKKLEVGPGMQIFGGGKPLTIQGLGITIDKNARFLNFKGSGITSVARVGKVVEIDISPAGVGTRVSEEVPVDSGDHINFTIAHEPTTGTFRLYRGGTRQASVGATPDYTLTGTALVLTTALDVDNEEVLLVDYEY